MAKKPKHRFKVAPVKKKAAAKKAPPKKEKKPRARKPQQERLLDDMPRDRVMDQYCETIADSLETINEAQDSLKGARSGALARMHDKAHFVYKAHGVELIYVKGDDKLKVKLVDSDEGAEAPADYVPGSEPGGAGDILNETNEADGEDLEA